ncbi:hypothetical protein AaE_005421 [Aphanomyces astaci]|uniref:Uncharacterized protein n=1 Tax=Aphanomyces astaci TaxID=112090 RepID=A0A6A5A2F9_APHAT|nr:hypothetical protein AaE_005421 [Aphanomyces astaci]
MASDEAVIQELTRQNKCVEDQQRKLRTRLDAMTHERQKLVSVFSTDNTKLLQELNVMAQRNHELQVRNGVLEADAAKRLRKGRGVEDRGGMQASQSLPDLPVVAATGESEASNQVEPTTTTVVDDQGPRIYIPCGVSVGAGPQKAKDLSPLKPLQRPRSSKPKQTTQPRPVNSMAQTKLYARRRPQSAHPTKSY